ncbi:TrmH family RNA methyltransferase [Corynebacterium mendelii]|uniref:RNA methyltransferase n=1 Tax=Corynebacterium mendelii TaxID=2765362 RepID=A0A939E2T9_9CORY|nr:RNA methyltransferase [Corynebacterium mendelii]MBN9644656.1 RNA methyltransferase [Corynebacterium mendelii]
MADVIARISIADPSDSRLDDFRDLNHSDRRPDRPGGKGLVIAEGVLVVSRLLGSRFGCRAVAGTAAKLDELLADPATAEAVRRTGCRVMEISREVLAAVAGFDLHRGLVASADRPVEHTVEQVIAGASTVVVLEGVGDHENIGSMFRNAAGMGVDGVLFGAGCADPLYRRVVRVSMGHVLRTPFAHTGGTPTTWQRSLALLADHGFTLVSLTPDPRARHIADVLDPPGGVPPAKVALLVGAEGPGLTEHAMRATDCRARIPMAAGTDSLNLAQAAAIAFYERQRSLRG